MQIFREKAGLQEAISDLRSQGSTVGFVPTMGALHEGHLSLIKQAAAANDAVVVSIFINPTQFDNPSDLANYPRTLEADLKLLENLHLNLLIFTPDPSDIYGNSIAAEQFQFDGLELEMEGEFRPGHFNGVGTVVKRLFEIVQPDKAYFGEKDFQQLQIIRKLTEKAGLPVDIVGCPIEREPGGLARSSRNKRLRPAEHTQASFIYQTLKKVRGKFGTESADQITRWVEKEFQAHPVLKLEYFRIADSNTLKTIKEITPGADYRAFIAVYAGDIRLIDNMPLNF